MGGVTETANCELRTNILVAARRFPKVLVRSSQFAARSSQF